MTDDIGYTVEFRTEPGPFDLSRSNIGHRDLLRSLCLAFGILPSLVGIDDPQLESLISLAQQRGREERTRRTAPGDLQAEIDRIEDSYAAR